MSAIGAGVQTSAFFSSQVNEHRLRIARPAAQLSNGSDWRRLFRFHPKEEMALVCHGSA